jgi:tetratricopeptide (TPR) repeat protein
MSENHFNFRLALGLLAVLLVAGAAVHAVHGYQVRRHARALLERADRAEEAGQNEQAAALLQRYLELAPDDTPALLRYGAALEKLPATPDNRWLAVAAYRQVLARSPSNADVRGRLADRLMELEEYAEARGQLEILLHAARSSSGSARVEARLARCREEEGDPEEALKAYEQAVEHDPALVECYSRQAALLYNHLGRPDDADAVMDRLVRKNEKNFEAHLGRCLYRMGRGRLDDAAQDLAAAQALAPDDGRVLVTAAELAYQRGRTGEARAAWAEGLKRHPEAVTMYLGLATLELSDGRPPEAVACLSRGLEKYPANADLLHLLTEAHLAQGDVAAAEKVAARARAALAGSDAPGVAEYLHARVLVHQGRSGEAIPLLEKALAPQDLPNPLAGRMYVCLAQCYERAGDNDRRTAAYRRAVQLEPSLVPAHLGLATALLAAGKSDEAVSTYRHLSRIPRPPEAVWVLLGRALFQRNLARPPAQREWGEIDQALARADEHESQAAAAAVLRTDVLLARGRPDEALRALDEARERRPDKVELWTALANLRARGGDAAGAERVLKEARARCGDRFELRVALLELGVGLEGGDARAALAEQEQGVERFAPEEQRRLLAALADLYYRLGFRRDGDRLTLDLLARQPLDLPAATAILDLALEGGDDAIQKRAVAELRRLEGDEGTWWRYGEAGRQLSRLRRGERAAADAARGQLAEIARRRPDWSRAALLEAALAETTGDLAAALKAYAAAFDRGERRPDVVYQLMRLLTAQGRHADADAVLSQAQEQLLPRGELARLGAETALRVRRHERAAALARLAVPAESRDFRHFVWLGNVLAAADRRPEAEAALRHAVEIRDNVPDTWVALVAFLARADRAREADDALRTMRDKLNAAQAPLALALCEEALGRIDAAEKHYREARALSPSDGPTLQRLAAFYVRLDRAKDAEPALRDLLDPTLRFPPGAAAENVAWARRQLALIRAEAGGEAGYAEARALLEANGGRDLADARAAALVRATRLAERPEALRALEETLAAQPLAPDEQFRLAKLYDAADDWGSAHDQLEALLKVDPRNPEYLAYFVAGLLRRGRRVEAQTWLTRLEQVEPDSARVKAFQTQTKQQR